MIESQKAQRSMNTSVVLVGWSRHEALLPEKDGVEKRIDAAVPFQPRLTMLRFRVPETGIAAPTDGFEPSGFSIV